MTRFRVKSKSEEILLRVVLSMELYDQINSGFLNGSVSYVYNQKNGHIRL